MAHHELTEWYIVLCSFIIFVLNYTALEPILNPFEPSKTGASRLYSMQDYKVGSKLGTRVIVNFFTTVKASTMCGVTVAILAIDFPCIYERIHAKSEEFGISCMDSGVALITLNSGLSCRKARPWHYSTNKQSIISEIIQTIKETAFLIILGFIRVMLV